MPETNIYLHFTGNCAEAFGFYEQALGGTITAMMTYGESLPPRQIEPGMADKIIHANLEFDGGRLMASDGPAEYQSKMSGFSISLTYADEETAGRMFDALAAGGKITMPFGKTFFSDGFGMLEDRFGTPWMVNTAVQEPANV